MIRQRLLAAAAAGSIFAGSMLPASAASQRLGPTTRQPLALTGTLSGNRTVTISKRGIAKITSADGRLIETRNVPIDTSSLSLTGGMNEDSKQALLQSLERPAYRAYVPGVVNVVFKGGATTSQDVEKFSNVSATSAPQYTTDSRVNAVLAKYGAFQMTRIARSLSRSKLSMMRSRAMSADRSILDLSNAFQVHVASGNVIQVSRELLKLSSVAYASPNWTVSTTNIGVHPLTAAAQMPDARSFGAKMQSARLKSSTDVSTDAVPTNYGVRTSLESWMNAPGVDGVAAYDEVVKKFGQLPGQGEIITNVSIGDVCANPDPRYSGTTMTSHVIGGQHYLDVPSMPLIPEYVADSDGNLSGQTDVCGVDPSDGEILMDFTVMAPMPAGQQRAGATGSGATDMLGIAPGAAYRLVVPGSDSSVGGLAAAFLAAADQTPNPNVITASLGWGMDAYGFPSRYLEEDPLMRSVISAIVNSDNIVVCISGGDGLRTYTNAAFNPMGGSVPTNLVATLDQQTNLNDVSFSSVASNVVDTGAIDVGGTTVDDILSANPLDPQFAQYANQLAFPEVRWNGFRSFSSGFGSRVNISAPSDNIPVMSFKTGTKTTYNAVQVGLDGGTSASAPMTAAAAAVMLQVARLTGHPFAKPTDVRAHLISTAVPVPNVPQADMQINVGPQLNVRRGVEKLLASAGMTVAPSMGRVAIAQRRIFNGASVSRSSRGYCFQFPEEDMFVEATDPTFITLNDPANCGAQPDARNLKSPITIAPDWESMPANARYKLYIAGHSDQVIATTPYARVYPQQIFQAAGLATTSATPRTITLTYEADAGLHTIASKTFDLTFSAMPAFSLTLDAPLVAPVIDSSQLKPCTLSSGQCFTVSYDFSNVPSNYYNNPTIEVSYPGRTMVNGYYNTAWSSPVLTSTKGSVEVPLNALAGDGIYGIMVNRWPDPLLNFYNLQAYSQEAITRVATASSNRANAPLVSLPTDAANGIAPSHGITLPSAGGSFIVSWDVSNVPGATNATLEFSAPGPNFVGNYNPFNNPNGSVVDNNGHDTGSTATIPLPSTKGTMTVTAAQANLVPEMGQVVRVIPQNGSTAVGEASDVSYVTEPGLFPIAPLSLIHGFAINPNGDDGVYTVDGMFQSSGPDTGSWAGTFSQTNKPNMVTINAKTTVGDPYTLFGYIGGGKMAFQQGAVSQADSQYGYDSMRPAAWQVATITPGTTSNWNYLRQYYPSALLPPGYDIVEAGRNMTATAGPLPVLAMSQASAASGRVTVAGTPTTGQMDTVTIGGTAVTFNQTTGNTPAQEATGLAAAINANGTVSALVTAATNAAVVTITAKATGISGNSITLTAASNGGETVTASGATLTGGNTQLGASNYGVFFLDGTTATPTVSASTFVPLTIPSTLPAGSALSKALIDYDPSASTAYVLTTVSKCSFTGTCTFDDYLVTVINPAVNPTATPTWTHIAAVGRILDFEIDPVNKVAAFTSNGPNDGSYNPTGSTLNVVDLSTFTPGTQPPVTTVNIPTSYYDYNYLTTKVAIDPVNKLIAIQNPVPKIDDTDSNPLSEIDFYDYTGHFVTNTPRNYNFKSYTLGDHWFQLNPGTRTMFVTTFSFDDIIPIKY